MAVTPLVSVETFYEFRPKFSLFSGKKRGAGAGTTAAKGLRVRDASPLLREDFK